jgi:hypothetical protein
MDAWADHPPVCGVVLLLSLACLLIVSQLVSGTLLPADSVAMGTLPMAAATAGESGPDEARSVLLELGYFAENPGLSFSSTLDSSKVLPLVADVELRPSVTDLEGPWSAEPWALPGTHLTTTHLERFNQRGLGITSLDVRHTWLLGYDDYAPLNITPGVAVHFWAGPNALDLPPRVYELFLDLQWQVWKGDEAAMLVGVTPGLYGDMEHIDNRSFQWSGWLVGSRQLGPRCTLLGGVAYLRQLQSNWLPVGGAIWVPNEHSRLELVFPRPRLARRVHGTDDWALWSYVAGQFGGGAWAVLDAPAQNVLVGYSDLRLLGGVEAFSRGGYEWRAELGYVFARELRVESVLLETPTDALLAHITVAF